MVASSDGSGHIRLPVVVRAQDLVAEATLDLEEWGGGPDGLVAYFEDLARSWRGWVGSKDWHDDGVSVWMSATHDRVGMVQMEVTLRPFAGWAGPGAWELSVVVGAEPGSLGALAEQVKTQLSR
jgi:hypothetical protein